MRRRSSFTGTTVRPLPNRVGVAAHKASERRMGPQDRRGSLRLSLQGRTGSWTEQVLAGESEGRSPQAEERVVKLLEARSAVPGHPIGSQLLDHQFPESV